jgi:protein-tyrosine phosphatase
MSEHTAGLHFVDIHCHLIPGIDDGARSWAESLQMARIAYEEGTRVIIATPHQLGAFDHIRGDRIRLAAQKLHDFCAQQDVAIDILPGADVRVESEMIHGLRRRDIVTLGDHGKHLLLELPHEMYVPLQACLDQLANERIVGILSHPERNQGLLRQPKIVGSLVEQGCLMQVTAGSLVGMFGTKCQVMAENLIRDGLVHFLATDAHGAQARRPLMRRAYLRVVEIAGEPMARELCCRNPALVAQGEQVPREVTKSPKRGARWIPWRRAA